MKLRRINELRYPDFSRGMRGNVYHRTKVTLTLRLAGREVEGGDIEIETWRLDPKRAQERLLGERLSRLGLETFAVLATMLLGVDVRSPVWEMLREAEGGRAG